MPAGSLDDQLVEALDSTSDPAVLVPGDVPGLQLFAHTVSGLARTMGSARSQVSALDLSRWSGDAATAFRLKTTALCDRLATVADAHQRVADAVSDYAYTLEGAQAQAGSAARSWNAGPSQQIGLSPLQQAAISTLLEARNAQFEAAKKAAEAITSALGDADLDDGRTSWLGRQWYEFWGGLAESISGTASVAWDTSPLHGIVDPGGYAQANADVVEGLVGEAEDPKQAGKDLLDWDTWADSPARALGHLAPDIALTAVTDGTGTVASRTTRAAAEIAEDSSKVVAKRAADAGAETGTVASLGKIADIGKNVADAAQAAEDAAKKARGRAANEVGAARERRVAELTGGTTPKRPNGQDIELRAPGIGKTGLDVLAPNGDYILVGGPKKAQKLHQLRRALEAAKAAAQRDGVQAIYYFEEGTPDSAIHLAEEVFGARNVHEFSME